uniref:Hsp20/alpha crystallin family protein n=1 Tax=Desulfatirhabdium butyrativorans TaxID=340467 RepID=A0A7C4RU55_9BACT
MMNLAPIVSRNWLDRPARDIFSWFWENTLPAFFEGDRECMWHPRLDVAESDREITVRAELPGLSKDDVQITLTNNVLTISGEKKREVENKNENYHLIERSFGSFCRTVALPSEVEADKVDAVYKDGVLSIRIPKSEKAVPKKITISD